MYTHTRSSREKHRARRGELNPYLSLFTPAHIPRPARWPQFLSSSSSSSQPRSVRRRTIREHIEREPASPAATAQAERRRLARRRCLAAAAETFFRRRIGTPASLSSTAAEADRGGSASGLSPRPRPRPPLPPLHGTQRSAARNPERTTCTNSAGSPRR